MPKVDLIALKDFKYNTRRLVAGDAFQARNSDDAMILVKLLGKARPGRPAAVVPPPPPEVAEKAATATQPKPVAKKAPAKRKAKAKK